MYIHGPYYTVCRSYVCICMVHTILYVGRIKAIYQRSGSKLTEDPQLYVKLAMFYRPEDTHKALSSGKTEADLCLLYWGDEGIGTHNTVGGTSLIWTLSGQIKVS